MLSKRFMSVIKAVIFSGSFLIFDMSMFFSLTVCFSLARKALSSSFAFIYFFTFSRSYDEYIFCVLENFKIAS